MSNALQKISGSKLEKVLEKLAGNRFKGLMFGLLVTAVIQSSSATTVMVIGFVNAGVMTLAQTVGIIFGANIGTTMTTQILRLGDISSDNIFLQILKPSGLTPIFLVIGFILYVAGKRRKRRDLGHVMIGFGVLFTGMMTMESAVAPLQHVEWFRELFVRFSNPFLGLVIGAVVTAIIQSSSASVGILQALSSTGQVPFSAAVPIILGQNIGTCITAMLSSVGTNKNARRAAFIHLLFNTLGALIFLIIILVLRPDRFLPFWNDTATRGMIANFHGVFNILCAAIALPFANILLNLSKLVIRQGNGEDEEAALIDDRLLNTPSIALEQVHAAVLRMAGDANQNLLSSISLISSFDKKAMQKLLEVENRLDRMEARFGNYLVRLANKDISKQNSTLLSGHLHIIGDIERIGDYSVNVAESAEWMNDEEMAFSDTAMRELKVLFSAVEEIMRVAIDCYNNRDTNAILRTEPLEEAIDLLVGTLKERHIERLKDGTCEIEAGTALLEILVNLERIADHCSNMSVFISHIYGAGHNHPNYDAHEHKRSLHRGEDAEYIERYNMLCESYMKRL